MDMMIQLWDLSSKPHKLGDKPVNNCRLFILIHGYGAHGEIAPISWDMGHWNSTPLGVLCRVGSQLDDC